MMTAYQPSAGGHPGLPHGHPGMGPQPGQHMGQPMQMHPGVSGAPHVSQPGAMMGMQPGAQMGHGGMGGQHPGGMMQAQMGGQSVPGGMPSAQAMSHMTPQQQMQHQQQAMAQMQANPQLAHQQQIMRLRQQQLMAQQQQANGMNMMQHGGMQISPQQLAQMQQHQQQQQQQGMQGGSQPVQLSAHLAQQMALRQQMAQQQQAQNHQMAAQQQHMAMQHANSQQSNQGQPPAQTQQGTPQQMRPASRMANPNEQTPTQAQQQPAQGQPQQGQPGQQQGQQPQQQGQQANSQQNQQQQAMALNQQRQQLAYFQRAQQRQMQQQAQAQAAQSGHGGMFILKLMNFCDHLSSFDETSGKKIENWHQLVERHFAPEGRLIHGIDGSNPAAPGRSRLFEVLRPSIARYFWTYFESGASSIRLHTELAREAPHATGGQQVTCQNAIFSVVYANGTRLEMVGALQALFTAGSDTMECLQFQTMTSEEVLTRSQIEKVISNWSPSLPTKSPKMPKKNAPKAQQKMQEQQEQLTMRHFPETSKGTFGITSRVQHFLEIGETMNVMSDIMWCAQDKKLRPEDAMEALLQQYQQSEGQPNGQQGGNPQINLPPNGVQRTPSMQNMQMPANGQAFSSPNVANLNLPNGMNGSPHMGNNPGNLAPNMNMSNSHTPSPHQGNMAAPQMVPQHSQQGTNSSVASANTSPNMNPNNKRRRSAVKMEDGDGGGPDGNANANRVKPSPRMAKKPKP